MEFPPIFRSQRVFFPSNPLASSLPPKLSISSHHPVRNQMLVA
jgi:hypothetical protein